MRLSAELPVYHKHRVPIFGFGGYPIPCVNSRTLNPNLLSGSVQLDGAYRSGKLLLICSSLPVDMFGTVSSASVETARYWRTSFVNALVGALSTPPFPYPPKPPFRTPSPQ